MKYNEFAGDLFEVRPEYTLVQCISSDCKMGAGIATQFVKHNPEMRETLLMMNPKVGDVLYYNGEGKNGVMNLITKDKYYNKPTRKSFNSTIDELKNKCIQYGINKIAMPLIGSGLDRLNWKQSSSYIKEVFKDTDIEIAVVIK